MPGVGLGIQRLRVIDLATGDQPIFNEDRSVAVVLNGEIYNYRELRDAPAARAATRFATQSDTEVIAHLYEEEGAALRPAPARDVRPSRSGTRGGAGCCWRATAWARSRSTTPSAAATLAFASELARASARTTRSRATSTTARSTPSSPTAGCRRP